MVGDGDWTCYHPSQDADGTLPGSGQPTTRSIRWFNLVERVWRANPTVLCNVRFYEAMIAVVLVSSRPFKDLPGVAQPRQHLLLLPFVGVT